MGERGGGGGRWAAGAFLPIGLLGASMSTRSAGPDTPSRPKRCLTNTGVNIRPTPTIHWAHYLSRDFTWSANTALEKQTSQLSLLMQQFWIWQTNKTFSKVYVATT